MRTTTAALALVVATTSSAACTLFNSLDGYSGGFADTGEPIADSGAKDTFVPPGDTGAKLDSSVDSAMADSAMTDSAMTDSAMTDSAMPIDTGSPKDSAADTADTSVVDTGVITDAPIGCHVVINEVQTRGTTTAGDEFIELYNPCTAAIDLSGYKVVYRSASNTTDVPVATISPGKSIAVGGFFLIGNGSFSTTSDQPFTASGIADDGAAAVRDAAGTQLDSVAWGSVVAGHAFLETAAAPRPAAGGSISRVPNGTDTNNNSVDFKPTTSTPKS